MCLVYGVPARTADGPPLDYDDYLLIKTEYDKGKGKWKYVNYYNNHCQQWELKKMISVGYQNHLMGL